MDETDRILAEFPEKLRPLAKAFLSSPYSAAPERKDELEQICKSTGFKIRLRPNAEDWLFEEFRMANLIVIGTRTLERIWAYCYGFNTMISELQKNGFGVGKKIEISADFSRAIDLINWANQKELEDIETGWPDTLPDPRSTSIDHVKTANHLFLMTSARLLLHEIAHNVLNHGTDPEADSECLHAEEHEADEWADSWILSRWTDYDSDEKVFVGRALGIALSHAPALVLASHQATRSDSHPPPMERVLRFASRNYPEAVPTDRDSRNLPCVFLLAISTYLLALKGFEIDLGKEEITYPEVFQMLTDHLE